MKNPGFLCKYFIDNHNSVKERNSNNCKEQCSECMDKVIDHHMKKGEYSKTKIKNQII